jgi:hypothetical protein
MASTLVAEREKVRRAGIVRNVEEPVRPAAGPTLVERDRAEAHAFGAAAAQMPAMRFWTWEDIAASLRDAWRLRHEQLGDTHYDWRLSWPAVREGWLVAGGAFAPGAPR